MTKFWTVVTAIIVVGLATLAVASNSSQDQLDVRDLETECRYDRGEQTNIELTPDNRLKFNGQFPVENTNAELKYDYSRSGDRIVLNIESEQMETPESFVNSCLGAAVYSAETPQLEEGSYEVTVRHDGEKVERQRLRVMG